jgi:hypothetical protein
MTDEREPTNETPTPDDATSRVPTPEPAPSPTAATPPNAPLTPASQSTATPPTFEHEVAWASGPVAASPVLPPKAPRRGGRLRWAVSLAVVALVVIASAAVAALITGQSSNATVLGYVPAGTTMYVEARLDLPGDQRRATGEFMSKFPGFADQAALDPKLDQVLDDLIKGATNNAESYTADIKPWFDGELAFSLGALPPAAGMMNGDAAAMSSMRALVLASVKDPALAQAWFNAHIAESGAKTTTETYNGATLTVFDADGGITPALAVIDGKVVVAGDITSVKAAVDTKGSGGFAAEPGPKAALDSSNEDYVGFVYVAIGPLLDWSNDMNAELSQVTGAPVAAMNEAMLKIIPDWGAYWVRFESDALVMDAVAPKPETVIGPTQNRASTVIEHIPGSAIVAATSNDYGANLKQVLDVYRSDPALKPMLDQVDQALGLVGGTDAALGWAGDSAVVINDTDTGPEGGVIVVPTDKAAAAQLFTSLRSFIALGGDQAGITIKDETYNGVTITIVDLGDLSKLTGMTGAAVPLPLPAGHLEIAYAVTDDIVVIGSGPGFVKHVLDTTKDTSLAANGRYKTLADRAGTGTGTTFVDLTAIREMIEKAAADGTADAAELAKYEKEIKPFLVPFDALVASGSVDGDLTRSVIYITVK